MPRVLADESTCPNCGKKLEKVPTRMRKCTSCNQLMYVRTGTDGKKYAVTEDELTILQKENNLSGKSKYPDSKYQDTYLNAAITLGISIFFILLAFWGVSSGWLIFLGIIFGIIFIFYFLFWNGYYPNNRVPYTSRRKIIYRFCFTFSILTLLVITPSVRMYQINNPPHPETALISNLQTNMKNVTFQGSGDYYSIGDGYMTGTIKNISSKTRDYQIEIDKYSHQEVWKKGMSTVGFDYDENGNFIKMPQYLDTGGTVTVSNVQPGEERNWECLMFKQSSSKDFYWWQWRASVDGWSWTY